VKPERGKSRGMFSERKGKINPRAGGKREPGEKSSLCAEKEKQSPGTAAGAHRKLGDGRT